MRGTARLAIALGVGALVLALDRLSKVLVVERLDLRSLGRIEVLDPWFNLTMAWNPGINFGLFGTGPGGRWLLVALAVGIVIALLAWLRRGGGWARAVGVGAIVGGALGNVWDRVSYGMVADFLNFSCCGIRNPFAFNIADAAIFGGALLLVFVQRDPAGGPAPRNRR